MNIERSKLFMIIGGVLMVLVVAAIIIIAIITPKNDDDAGEEKTVEQVQQENIDNYYAGENGNEEAADIIESDQNPDTPPSGLYENSYDDDYGYVPLTDHESAKINTDNTVYDDVWASTKWKELNCDLSKKKTISDKSLSSLRDLRKDLQLVNSDMSRQLVTSTDYILSKLTNSRGKRMPGEVLDITSYNCLTLTEEVTI